MVVVDIVLDFNISKQMERVGRNSVTLGKLWQKPEVVNFAHYTLNLTQANQIANQIPATDYKFSLKTEPVRNVHFTNGQMYKVKNVLIDLNQISYLHQ